MIRAILACSGRDPDPKWGNYLGVPKHLAPVHGQPLLERTVEQLLVTDEVYISYPPGRFQQYHVADTLMFEGVGENEYTCTRGYWNERGRTILLLGDVYFTDAAMKTILAYDKRQVRWFGRMKASRVTGTRYGEIFAISWWPEHHKLLDRHLGFVVNTPQNRRPPGWKLYRSIHGANMSRHQNLGNWTEINDATDDFDHPHDYDRHPAVKRGSP